MLVFSHAHKMRGLFETMEDYMAKKPTLDTNAMALKRWRSRLKRAMTMIDKLEKQRRRLEAKPVDLAITTGKRPEPKAIPASALVAAVKTVIKPAEIDTSIPAFLQRKPLDPVAAEIKQEQEATKKKKAAGRIAKMKAKASGETKRMPLTGRAALEAIRNA